jgi:hypothetical protein
MRDHERAFADAVDRYAAYGAALRARGAVLKHDTATALGRLADARARCAAVRAAVDPTRALATERAAPIVGRPPRARRAPVIGPVGI